MPALTRRFALLGCLLALTGAPLQAAGRAGATDPNTPADGTTPRRKRAPSVRVPRYASGETHAQRQRREEARLKRECRGRPNAGACLGYAR